LVHWAYTDRRDEIIKKISDAQKGKPKPPQCGFQKGHPINPEWEAKRIAAITGREKTKEERRAISERMMGHPVSEENKRKLSEIKKGNTYGSKNKGRKASEETCRKLSESHKGQVPWNKGIQTGVVPWNKGISPSEETRRKLHDANVGKVLSQETRDKMSKSRSGERNPLWKGGISKYPFEETHGLTVRQWQRLATKIRARDRHICQYCGAPNSYIVHHIHPRNSGIDNHPDNLLVLCSICHQKVEHLTMEYIAKGFDPFAIFTERWNI